MVESVPAMSSVEQLLCALRRTPAKGGARPSAIIDRVQEWKGLGESMVKSLADYLSDIESREEKLRVVGESLETRLKNLQETERALKLLQEGKEVALDFREEQLKSREAKLDEQLKSVDQHIESLEASHGEVECLRKKEREKLKEIEKRERELDAVRGLLDRRLGEFENREKEFDRVSRELSLKEENLVKEKKEFAEEIRLTNEKLQEKHKLGCGLITRLEMALNMLDKMKGIMDERFIEVESRESTAHESLTARLDEADLIRKSLEKRFSEVEDAEKDLLLKEQSLEKRFSEIDYAEREIKSKEQSLEKRFNEIDDAERELKSKEQLVEKRFSEIDDAEKELKSKEQSLEKSFSEIDDAKKELKSKEQSLEKRFREIDDAKKELKSKEQSLEKRFREIDDAEKELKSKEQLLEKRFSEIDDAKKELKSKEQSLEKRFSEIEDAEKKLKSKEQQLTMRIREVELRGEKSSEQQKLGNIPEGKKTEPELKQLNLVSCKTEPGYEEHDTREKNLSSVRESALTCVKEYLAPSKLDQRQKESSVARVLQGSGQPLLLTANTDVPRDTSVVLRDALQEDRKNLELLIDCHEQDMKLMGDEIRKLLAQSSEPARLVVEAVEEFYALRSGKLDMGCKEGRATFLMLGQLTILSPKIEPCVKEAALKLALEWRSKMSYTPTKALAFLHLVAAYELSSNFDKDELFGFLKLAAKHRQTPDLCRSLGLEDEIPGHIHKLINEKQFLIASTYVHAYQLQNMFSQRSILNYYVNNAKLSAKARLRGARNPSEAKEKAILSEIAALRSVIEHITKYELQSAYSPNALTAKITQLEANRANLRRAIPSSLAKIQDESKGRFRQENRKAKFNKRKRRFNHEATESATIVLDHQVAPCHGSKNWSSPSPAPAPARGPQRGVSYTETQPAGPRCSISWSSPLPLPPPPPPPAWGPQHELSHAETQSAGPPHPCSINWSSPPPPPPPPAPAWGPQHEVGQTETQPAGPPHSWVPINMVPMPHHPAVRPFKRGRPNTWMNGGGFQQGQFANSQ